MYPRVITELSIVPRVILYRGLAYISRSVYDLLSGRIYVFPCKLFSLHLASGGHPYQFLLCLSPTARNRVSSAARHIYNEYTKGIPRLDKSFSRANGQSPRCELGGIENCSSHFNVYTFLFLLKESTIAKEIFFISRE